MLVPLFRPGMGGGGAARCEDRSRRGGQADRIGEVDVNALVDVDLHVEATSLVVILGPSGSGKTTLLNMIGLLDAPGEGRVRLAGRGVLVPDS